MKKLQTNALKLAKQENIVDAKITQEIQPRISEELNNFAIVGDSGWKEYYTLDDSSNYWNNKIKHVTKYNFVFDITNLYTSDTDLYKFQPIITAKTENNELIDSTFIPDKYYIEGEWDRSLDGYYYNNEQLTSGEHGVLLENEFPEAYRAVKRFDLASIEVGQPIPALFLRCNVRESFYNWKIVNGEIIWELDYTITHLILYNPEFQHSGYGYEGDTVSGYCAEHHTIESFTYHSSGSRRIWFNVRQETTDIYNPYTYWYPGDIRCPNTNRTGYGVGGFTNLFDTSPGLIGQYKFKTNQVFLGENFQENNSTLLIAGYNSSSFPEGHISTIFNSDNNNYQQDNLTTFIFKENNKTYISVSGYLLFPTEIAIYGSERNLYGNVFTYEYIEEDGYWELTDIKTELKSEKYQYRFNQVKINIRCELLFENNVYLTGTGL